MRDEAFSVLIDAFQTRDNELRADVAYVLANMRNPYLVRCLESDADLLIRAVHDNPFWRARANAAYAIISADPSPDIISVFCRLPEIRMIEFG